MVSNIIVVISGSAFSVFFSTSPHRLYKYQSTSQLEVPNHFDIGAFCLRGVMIIFDISGPHK